MEFCAAGAGRAELHASMQMDGEMTMDSVGQVLVNAGDEETFEPGGYHVMVFDLDPAIAAGDTAEMTLTVVGGKQKSFPVEVRAAGDER